MHKVGLIQFSASDQPAENLQTVLQMIRDAHTQGAQFILTPEATNCISTDQQHQCSVFYHQNDDPSLKAYQVIAAELGVWLLIGSLLILSNDPDGRFTNRCFMIGPDGKISAQYDKIHMFDVTLSKSETFRESNGYRPGGKAVLAGCDFGTVGITICYDLRFPHLFRILAQAGAQIITVPAAFTQTSGEAHWHVLLRARAIETGSYVLASGQVGDHEGGRKTYGHAMIIDPWGHVIAQIDDDEGVILADLDIEAVNKARSSIPALKHDRDYTT